LAKKRQSTQDGENKDEDEDEDEHLQEPIEIINLKPKRGAFILKIGDNPENTK